MRIRWCKENKLLAVEFAVGIFLKSFFIYLTYIFGEKKSAQISILSTAIDRKTMFPVDWCIQIVFLIFQKIEFLDADASNATFHRKTLMSCHAHLTYSTQHASSSSLITH